MCAGTSACLIPVFAENKSFFLGFVVAYSFFLPFAALWGPAKISSDCDRLTKRLNRLRFEGDVAHKDRVAHLYNTLRDLNIQQGLGMRPPAGPRSFLLLLRGALSGFTVFGIVVNKRTLKTWAIAAASLGASAVTALAELGSAEAGSLSS